MMRDRAAESFIKHFGNDTPEEIEIITSVDMQVFQDNTLYKIKNSKEIKSKDTVKTFEADITGDIGVLEKLLENDLGVKVKLVQRQ